MGNRVSIQFHNKESSFQEKSVVFFSHWDGTILVENAKQYIKSLNDEEYDGVSDPLARREVGTIIVDFLRWMLTAGQEEDEGRVRSNYYLGVDENDGDNGDNGHFLIDVHTGEADR